MKRQLAILTSIFLAAIPAMTFAADPDPKAGYYQGMIGTHPIVMTLGIGQGDDTAGRYRYLQHGPGIWLSDEDPGSGDIVLSEWDPNHPDATAQFYGKLDAHQNFVGVWETVGDSKAKRSIHCKLSRIADLAEYKLQEPRFTISYKIPQFRDPSPFYVALNARLVAHAKKLEAQSAADFRKIAIAEDSARHPYHHLGTMEVLHADDTMVTLLGEDNEDTGGAHDIGGYYSETFIWQDGELVELHPRDMISTRSLKSLGSMIVADLKRQNAGWPDDAAKVNLDTITVNPTVGGLMFTYGEYEVSSYAEGPFTVMLPYSALKKIIPSDSPIQYLTKPARGHDAEASANE